MNSFVKFYTELNIDPHMITISESIKAVDTLNGIRCNENKFIPVNNWRHLTSNEKSEIFSSSEENKYNQTIGLVEIPNEIVRQQFIDKIKHINIDTATKSFALGAEKQLMFC